MGKAKSKKKGSEPSTASKKCACDHPYRCQCGNRPERPSKGHKWDPATQQWGGKGHKQKGASGQTATVAQADRVTSGGGVVLKQWQKLPSRLLADLCKKHGKGLGRGMPIYRPVGNRGGGGRGNEGGRGNDSAGRGNSTNSSGAHRYRLVLPSTSKKNASDHDIVLVPSLSVSNDEQAKEEAALLGLLYLFPTLPHERTLPEPYRSTFLAARKNRTEEGGGGGEGKKTGGTNETEREAKSSAAKAGGAAANVQLTANLPSFQTKRPTSNNHNNHAKSSSTASSSNGPLLTRAQQTEARAAHRREVQARIRKHEALRAANKPMEVFMSARVRGRIERLLAGEAGGEVFEDENEDEGAEEEDALEDDEEEGEDGEDVVRSYVRQRLLHEGFGASHVSKAYREVASKHNAGVDGPPEGSPDERMDLTYEATLQYLCIHLREDQLPIGLDPRGGTLDVLRPAKKAAANAAGKAAGKGAGENTKESEKAATKYDATILRLAEYFGLAPREAAAIASSDEAAFALLDEATTKRAFWKVLATAAALPVDRTCFADDDAANAIAEEERQRNAEAAANELEALEAIFAAGECATQKAGGTTAVSIALPLGESQLSLDVHYRDGRYPDRLPMAFVTTGRWNDGSGKARATKGYRCGGRVNLKLAEDPSAHDNQPAARITITLVDRVLSEAPLDRPQKSQKRRPIAAILPPTERPRPPASIAPPAAPIRSIPGDRRLQGPPLQPPPAGKNRPLSRPPALGSRRFLDGWKARALLHRLRPSPRRFGDVLPIDSTRAGAAPRRIARRSDSRNGADEENATPPAVPSTDSLRSSNNNAIPAGAANHGLLLLACRLVVVGHRLARR